ncbi:proteasome subunit beta type-6 [Schistocerca nitens]|uniref:proteasome subunit beta type-6 n=1 Tax=Schistocerca nitens TaxID=7011 RepID=UPI002119138E|nr:proteasome subunit beta type-6 [Schistocerca nitens]XP_049844011.1 proteasome subunit beta type-6-like [Schistocerca gregaria]
MASVGTMKYPVESIRAGPMDEDWMNAEHMTGTSIMAVEYDGGVVIGADSRTTTGTYIANRVTDKLTRITDTIYCCRSGSAADTQNIADIVAYHLDFMQVEMGEPPQVKTAANVFRELCYNYRDSLVAGVIVAGWDKRRGGQVYSVPIGGMCVRMPVTIGGSGSTYVYGYVDANFKLGMTRQECLQFVTNTLTLAMMRDGSSGGVVRLAAIGESGVERHTVLAGELPRFYED